MSIGSIIRILFVNRTCQHCCPDCIRHVFKRFSSKVSKLNTLNMNPM